MRLSSGDVCEVAGIPMNLLDRWVTQGWVGPHDAFSGKGRHRVYNLTQCLAIAAGAAYQAEGAHHERVAGIVRFVAGLTVERLEARLSQGHTFPVPGAMLGMVQLPGVMIAPPMEDVPPEVAASMKRVDMGTIYADVKRKVAKIQQRADAQRTIGRKQGRVRVSLNNQE